MHHGGAQAGGFVAPLRRLAIGLVVAAALAGCGADDEPPERADATTTTSLASSTTTSSTEVPPDETTTTTAPAHDFEPLLADPALTPEEQVEAAYLYHWEVLSYAGRTGDTSVLPLVFADAALELREEQVNGLVARNLRMDGYVDHRYAITAYDESTALVTDAYRDFLEHRDAATGDPVTVNTGELRLVDFHLVKRGGTWVIVEVEALELQ